MAVVTRICAALILVLLVASPALAQTPPPSRADAETRPAAVKVFLDCVNASCDSEFFRTDISFVDHVRDRKDADVHVLITAEETGGGGEKYTLNFIGLGRFAGVDHLLHYVSKAAETSDELRRGLAGTIKMGLVHYVADTPVASELQITHTRPARATSGGVVLRDPWDYWYMRSSLSVYTNGERLTNSTSIYGSVGTSRVTNALKIDLSGNVDYGRSRYTLDEGSDLVSISRSLSLNGLFVASITPRWSAGVRASASSSTYYNQHLALRLTPAIEYNIYPYSESTRRQFTFNYSAGVRRFRYNEETIFGKDSESLPTHSFLASGTFKQPWGSFYTSFEATQYLQDLSKNRLIVYNSISVRLFKGFSVRLYGDVERIRDQVYLARGGASLDEILLRRRQLATSYSYYTSFGFSYSFGSIHNNIVNTRFDSSY
jgi:hypothetical protein